jgi:RNA 2',3'-cyclic 3'-phosphodiesterase
MEVKREEAESGSCDAWRLFIAIPVPEEVKDAIQLAQGELRRAVPAKCVRWAGLEQFHLTLKFLGNVAAARVEALADSVRSACRNLPALRLRAERIGFFPDMRFPRVIWAWVHDGEQRLPMLQQTIETATRDFTGEKAEDKFTGHVTLGRVKAIKRPEAEILAKLASSMTDRFFGEWTADKIEVIRSELSSKGSRYSTISAVPLVDGTVRSDGIS